MSLSRYFKEKGNFSEICKSMPNFYSTWTVYLLLHTGPLRENRPNTEFFLLWIQENTNQKTPYLGTFHVVGECLGSLFEKWYLNSVVNTAKKEKFSIKDFFSKCDQIRGFLRIWSHLLKKSLMDEETLNGKLHFLCSGKDVGDKWRNLQDLTKHLNDEYFINRPNIIRIVISILVFRIYLLLQNLATRYKKIYPCYHLNTLMKSFVVISSNIHLTYMCFLRIPIYNRPKYQCKKSFFKKFGCWYAR